MDNKNDKKEIRDAVLQIIKRGKVKMAPRWQFILRAIALALFAAIAFLALLYVTSFIFFTVGRSGALFAPGLGSRGYYILFRSLPWVLILLSLVCIGVLEILVRKYAFAYRNPLIYSILGILTVSLVAGGAFAPFHHPGPDHGHEPHGGFHGFEHHQPPEVYRGVVISMLSNGFILQNLDDGTSSVFVDDQTQITGMFGTSSDVVVFGDECGENICAFGVRLVSR